MQRLIDCEGTVEAQHQWLELIAQNVPMPIAELSGLIHNPPYNKRPDAGDVVSKAMSYKKGVIHL